MEAMDMADPDLEVMEKDMVDMVTIKTVSCNIWEHQKIGYANQLSRDVKIMEMAAIEDKEAKHAKFCKCL
ncbi:hypothetical protein AVEN_237671-1 [Araneus ventricosus]|uniref:Uncharacterized protein n=1 Tax=Araneus ventricosus TaxID=182803 RepID=A0A4Y1ZVN2_ARAVE|nr:hypothetical protein AVEN_237671-1 [Araneus ventricosus]